MADIWNTVNEANTASTTISEGGPNVDDTATFVNAVNKAVMLTKGKLDVLTAASAAGKGMVGRG